MIRISRSNLRWRSVLPATILAVCVLGSAIPARAVIISGGDGSGNITTPNGDQGWSYVGIVNGNSGVYTNSVELFDEIRVGTTAADVTPVPEPAIFCMAGLGILALITLRRKK